jgi:hypothetical protein
MWTRSCARMSVNMARTPLPWTTDAPPTTRYDAVTCDREWGCGVQPSSLLYFVCLQLVREIYPKGIQRGLF